jgi:hypothetical protein
MYLHLQVQTTVNRATATSPQAAIGNTPIITHKKARRSYPGMAYPT